MNSAEVKDPSFSGSESESDSALLSLPDSVRKHKDEQHTIYLELGFCIIFNRILGLILHMQNIFKLSFNIRESKLQSF